MKNKIILTILAVLIATVSYAQCDTVAIKAPIRFDTETIVTKSGKSLKSFMLFIMEKLMIALKLL